MLSAIRAAQQCIAMRTQCFSGLRHYKLLAVKACSIVEVPQNPSLGVRAFSRQNCLAARASVIRDTILTGSIVATAGAPVNRPNNLWVVKASR